MRQRVPALLYRIRRIAEARTAVILQDSGIVNGGCRWRRQFVFPGSKLGLVSDKTNTGASKTLSTAAASKAASDAAAAAIADAQAAGQSSANASVTFNNVSSLTPEAIKAINDAVAAAEANSGVSVNLTINIDKVVNGKVITVSRLIRLIWQALQRPSTRRFPAM